MMVSRVKCVANRAIHWFRSDLRLRDNPALCAAFESASGGVIPLYVVDPEAWKAMGDVSRAYLTRSLHALNQSLDGNLVVRIGQPAEVLPAVTQEWGVQSLHYAADFTPRGIERDSQVAERLAALELEVYVTGSSYAVSPGRIRKGDSNPYRVYTPFYRAWAEHGWRPPIGAPRDERWLREEGDALPAPNDVDVELPPAGEQAAIDRWTTFLAESLDDYATARDRLDLDGTSRLSPHLAVGELHPRTLLAALGSDKAQEVFRRELAWREFYADVLFHHPASADHYLNQRFSRMTYDTGEQAQRHLAAWQEGRTGYPLVDAAMRQLLRSGWMHNRARMLVASFLVKDLHLEWQQGADWFMQRLVDADVASNSHGWQWTAGSGTDAAPYFRVFNPTTQAKKFDPNGDYVRRYVAELRHLAAGAVHEPWKHPDGYAYGYPERIVDHAVEREESLRRYQGLS